MSICCPTICSISGKSLRPWVHQAAIWGHMALTWLCVAPGWPRGYLDWGNNRVTIIKCKVAVLGCVFKQYEIGKEDEKSDYYDLINENHEFHENCHSVTFCFMKKKLFYDISSKCILPNMIIVVKCTSW